MSDVNFQIDELKTEASGTRLQQFAQFALEHVSDAVYWIRLDGSLVYVNQAACDMLGFTKEELYGKLIFDIDPYLPAERWKPVWDALLQQGQRRFQSAHRTRDGRSLPVEITSSVFELDGEQFGCSLARDISKRSEAEEAHQREHSLIESLIETAPVLIAVLDSQGQVVRFNHCAERATGYRFDEIQGKSWIETFVAESNRDEVRALLQKSMSGATMRGVVYGIMTRTGSQREVLWHDQLLSNVGSETLGLLVIGQDITDHRELELRLHQAEKMEAIGRLAGGVAHDFNNQLACIMGWVEILENETQNESVVRECAERILQASRRAGDLTSQLLAYSRKGKYVTRPVDLHELVNEVTAMLRRSIDKRITLQIDLNAPEFHTLGDSTQLGNAILNLTLNARDAMPNGGTLAIKTEQRQIDKDTAEAAPHEIVPGTYIDLSVSDTGTGMDDDTQRRMFEPFFTTKDEGRGIGMGLAAVYGTVKSHHGTISTQSSPGLGTSIHILLPVTQVEVQGSVVLRKTEQGPLAAYNVMVVDDEEPVREVTSRLLSHLGCKVVNFSDGFDAIEYYRTQGADVDTVVLDMVMPLLDGKSVYYALRQINPQVHVILASGYSLDGVVQSLLDEGVAGFIQKPFTLLTLSEALSKIAKPKQNESRTEEMPGQEPILSSP
jgi:two-component system cell cycle sensor histidine kinase/response regulator CckA